MGKTDLHRVLAALGKSRLVLLVLALGLALLLLPKSGGSASAGSAQAGAEADRGDPLQSSGIPLETESRRLAELLRAVRGVGEAEVLLSAQGAVVVCTGGDDPAVRLRVTDAVSVYTGLGSDRIRVIAGKR